MAASKDTAAAAAAASGTSVIDVGTSTVVQQRSVGFDVPAVSFANGGGLDDDDNDDDYGGLMDRPDAEDDDLQPSATVTSSSVNLTNTILGAGLLAMPAAMSTVGVLPGLFVLTISAALSGLGLYFLGACARRISGGGLLRNASFFAVAQATYPKAAVAIDAAIAIKCFGVAISYLIIFGQLMPQVMEAIGLVKLPPSTGGGMGGGGHLKVNSVADDVVVPAAGKWVSAVMARVAYSVSTNATTTELPELPPLAALLASQGFWTTMGVVSVAPLAFFKRLDSLKNVSVVALASVVYVVCMVIVFFLDPARVPPPPGSISWAKLDARAFLESLPIFVFGFTCHQNIFTVHNELRNNSARSTTSVTWISISAALSAYVTVATLGYLTFGDAVLSNLILMYDGSGSTVARIGIAVGRIAIAILVLSSFPLQAHPCRASINKVICSLFPGIDDEPDYRTLSQSGASSVAGLDSDGDNESDTSSINSIASTASTTSTTSFSTRKPLQAMADIPHRRFVLITLSILLGTYFIAMVSSNISTVMAFVGSTGSTTVSFILPGLFYVKLSRERDALDAAGVEVGLATGAQMRRRRRRKIRRLVAKLLVIYGVAVMVVCLTMNILKLNA
ncbi:hypothetical protein GQ42DRAFT_164757 [Ramicandelaber brevisporus]|nr:hypothetical protein GQ42DRAFT_164757 [Ramicandelaber brevisporus]